MGRRTCLHHLLNSNPISWRCPSVVSSLDSEGKKKFGGGVFFTMMEGWMEIEYTKEMISSFLMCELKKLHSLHDRQLTKKSWVVGLFYVFMREEEFFLTIFSSSYFPWVVKLTFCSWRISQFQVVNPAQYRRFIIDQREILREGQHRLGKVNYDGVNMQM